MKFRKFDIQLFKRYFDLKNILNISLNIFHELIQFEIGSNIFSIYKLGQKEFSISYSFWIGSDLFITI